MSALKYNIFKAIDFLIKVESGPDKGRVYRLLPPQVTLGRDPSTCQIVLGDAKVSRQQCTIKFKDNVICEDLSTRKTTLVNGHPCRRTILKPGDRISFGDTSLVFETRSKAQPTPELGGQTQPTEEARNKSEGRKKFRLFLIAIIALFGVVLALQQENSAPPSENLATQEDLNKQIEASRERASLLRDSREEKIKLNDKKYLYSVEKHFISGFRDFQNGRYGRALDSFGTTIATDQTHARAQQYAKSARKKQGDLIDTHLRDGEKYKNKMMFNRCAAEYEKALVLITNVNSKRYDLAKAQLTECRLLKTGGYQ